MNLWALILVVTGIVCIAVSVKSLRHSSASSDFIAVHKNMDDDRISDQMNKGPIRVDAKLGIQFGASFIALGLLWQLVVSWYWF